MFKISPTFAPAMLSVYVLAAYQEDEANNAPSESLFDPGGITCEKYDLLEFTGHLAEIFDPPQGIEVRVVRQGQGEAMVTPDYRPNRITLLVDSNQRILQASCGQSPAFQSTLPRNCGATASPCGKLPLFCGGKATFCADDV